MWMESIQLIQILITQQKKIDKIAYEEMLEMASMGAKVLQTRSVELAMKDNIPLQVISSFTNLPGTMIIKEDDLIENLESYRNLILPIAVVEIGFLHLLQQLPYSDNEKD